MPRTPYILLPLAAIALGAACSSSNGGGGGVLSASNYNQSCAQNSDCVPIFAGTPSCCDCPNAAINKSDEAKYQADFQAASSQHGVCNVACIACPAQAAVCVGGMCTLATLADAGNEGGGSACGGTTCGPGDLCVMDQFEGGVALGPNDAGMCPDGDVLGSNGLCTALPTYRCSPTPAACASGLTCGCAQPLCDSGYTCMQASAGLVQCYLMAP